MIVMMSLYTKIISYVTATSLITCHSIRQIAAHQSKSS